MGAAQVIGTLLAQGLRLGTVQTPNEDVILTINGWEHQLEFVLPWVGMEGSIPNRYTPDPKYPGLNLMEGHAKKWMGNLARITLTYRTPDYPITSTDGTPPDEFQENPSAQVESIVANPYFTATPIGAPVPTGGTLQGPDSSTPSTAVVDDSGTFVRLSPFAPGDKGLTDFYQGTKSIVHTQYSPRLSASLFETSIQEQPDPDSYVVIVTDMPGIYDGGENQYIRLTSEVNQAGLWWKKTNTYLFRDAGWSTNAYAVE